MVQRWRQGQRTLLAVAGLGWLAYKALQWGRQENLYGQGSADYRGLTGTRSGAGTRVCAGGVSVGPRRP